MPSGEPGTDPWQSNFGSEDPFAPGVEEELLLVDEQNGLAESSVDTREEADAEAESGDVTSELYRAMVEDRSDVQREVHRDGGMEGLLEWLVEASGDTGHTAGSEQGRVAMPRT